MDHIKIGCKWQVGPFTLTKRYNDWHCTIKGMGTWSCGELPDEALGSMVLNLISNNFKIEVKNGKGR